MKVLEISKGTAAGYAGLLLSQMQVEVDRLDLSDEPEGEDPFLHRDKKRIGPNIRFVVAHDVGDVRTSDLSLDSLRAALGDGNA